MTLSHRLDFLAESYKQLLHQIHRMPKIQDPEDLADLTTTIRDTLNALSEDLDLLNLEIEDVATVRQDREEGREKLRLSVQAQRLQEDLKNARNTFRRTQLYIKRAGEAARKKDRDDRMKVLTEPPRADTPDDRTTPMSSTILPGKGKRRKAEATNDDILLNASGDVLDALRKTHTLMSTELERSQLAQEILAQSSMELQQLNESYTDLDSMLKTSKGLVTQLMKSNKSDTWYLLTARNVLMVILAWLVWRRILWGPTWWLVWMPLKIMYMTLMLILSPFGMSGGSELEEPRSALKVLPSASERAPMMSMGRQAPHVHAGRGGGVPMQDPSPDGSLTQRVGKMVDETEKMVRGDGQVLVDSDQPRNPKRRVMDTGEGLGAGDIIEGLEGEQDEEPGTVEEEQPAAMAEQEKVRDEL